MLSERDLVHLAGRTWIRPASPWRRSCGVRYGSIDAASSLQEARARCRRPASAVSRRGRTLVGLITRHDIVKALQGRYVEYLDETSGSARGDGTGRGPDARVQQRLRGPA